MLNFGTDLILQFMEIFSLKQKYLYMINLFWIVLEGLFCKTGNCKPLASPLVRWFFPGFSDFRPPLMNDQFDISEIYLKEP